MIGRAVVEKLLGRGDEVTVLSRDAAKASSVLGDAVRALEWREPRADAPPAEALAGQDGVIHLLGAPVAQRWSDEAKREIRDSRVLSTRNLVMAMHEAEPRPCLLYTSPSPRDRS